MNRRFGHWPDPNHRYRPRAGAYAIIDAGDGILATFQEEPDAEFQLPGGGIDAGETAVQALHREVLEETGYRIHSIRRLGMFHRHTFMPDYGYHAHKQCHIFHARLGRRMGAPTEPGHSAIFMPWTDALSLLAVSGDRYFLAQYLAARLHRNQG
ncbi:NUDIX hydrolase [Rhodobacteraceae bacterium XHP0102]|nr:NUDIX hydrolase [Rhodobacteraceae bacterium XHP0102]